MGEHNEISAVQNKHCGGVKKQNKTDKTYCLTVNYESVLTNVFSVVSAYVSALCQR